MPFLDQHPAQPARRPIPRGIGIEADDNLLRKAADQLGVVLGKTGAERGHRLGKTGRLGPQHVQLPFAHHRPTGFRHRPAGPIETKEHFPFFEEHRLGGVHVFRFVRGRSGQHPAAESDHPAALVVNREHQAVAEPVVDPARLRLECHPGGNHLLLAETVFLSPIQRGRPGGWRVAETETGNPFVGNLALLEVGPSRLS